jgi:hypothetical protein
LFSVSGKAPNAYLSGKGMFVSRLVAFEVLLLHSGEVVKFLKTSGHFTMSLGCVLPVETLAGVLMLFVRKKVYTSLYEGSWRIAFDIELPSFTPLYPSNFLLWPLHDAYVGATI